MAVWVACVLRLTWLAPVALLVPRAMARPAQSPACSLSGCCWLSRSIDLLGSPLQIAVPLESYPLSILFATTTRYIVVAIWNLAACSIIIAPLVLSLVHRLFPDGRS